ncbi:hypothetical protein [Kushneria marisflavi]|uniref:Uncharacterized protein n=1 Tax=Kushneria marisflavi TaxID=157779 RepID=A0A240URM4_9GAMM|nr:hypothetical protein [Kushneria marisflavi]ART64134.1 hypothetical protein B9H00_14620 [Kushneria marisflavi]RKD85882.1 hypothetical protein C8D96_1784 [Kushneria marisflavi]
MLISDSIPLLWLCWFVLSVAVLVFGYFAISFLPRLPRWLVTGAVAGLLWMPAFFSVPGPQSELGYSGWAPSLVVTAVGFLQHNGGQILFGGALMAIGAVLGMLVTFFIGRRGRHDHDDDDRSGNARNRDSRDDRDVSRQRRESAPARREPSLGR